MKEKKLTTRQLQAIETKQRIYDAAMSLIDKHGFTHTTIEDISKKAGVSIGAFYHYYKSKEEIYDELFSLCDDYFKVTVEPLIKNLPAWEQVSVFFSHYGRYSANRGVEAISHMYHTKNYHFVAPGSYMHLLLQKIIEDGQNSKQLNKTMTPVELEDFLFIQARGMIFDWCLHKGDYDLKQRMTDMTKLTMKLYLL